jgi:hypothetical protein
VFHFWLSHASSAIHPSRLNKLVPASAKSRRSLLLVSSPVANKLKLWYHGYAVHLDWKWLLFTTDVFHMKHLKAVSMIFNQLYTLFSPPHHLFLIVNTIQ